MTSTLLLICGKDNDARVFDAWIPILSKTYHIITYAHNTLYKKQSIRDMALEAFKRIQNVEQICVIGHSMGGYIAQSMAILNPTKIQKMVLISTNARALDDPQKARHYRDSLSLVKSYEKYMEHVTSTPRYVLSHKSYQDVRLRELITTMMIELGRQQLKHDEYAVLTRANLLPFIPYYLNPVLIITGEEDRVSAPAMSEEMAQLYPNATLQVLKDTGHMPTLEQPQQVLQYIQQFL